MKKLKEIFIRNSFYGFQVKKYHQEIFMSHVKCHIHNVDFGLRLDRQSERPNAVRLTGSRVESGRCQKSKATDFAQSGRCC